MIFGEGRISWAGIDSVPKLCLTAVLLIGLAWVPLAGRAEVPALTGEMSQTRSSHNKSVIWALNIGGADYVDRANVHYQADQAVSGGERGQIDKILAAQDSFIYKSYRSGNLVIEKPLANGVYDITFQFAEPDDIKTGARVFDVFAEEQRVIAALDVRLATLGNHATALKHTVTDVEVSDGQLNIAFSANAGKPLLNGLVVRNKVADRRDWELVWGRHSRMNCPHYQTLLCKGVGKRLLVNRTDTDISRPSRYLMADS